MNAPEALKAVTLEHVLYSRCRRSPEYFLRHYCQVYDATSKKWVPFDLWPAQADALRTMTTQKLIVMLKARQLGFSWLVVGMVLWLMIFHPAATVLIFSKRDDEAVELLNFRLKGMFNLLPPWMRPDAGLPDKAHQWMLANGSRAMALPTTGGRSYTGTLVIVDEADYIPNLNNLLNAVKPTVDAGGTLVLLSTVDKALPESTFKKIYLAAKAGENAYAPIFCGWQARPGRTPEWYEEQKRDSLARTGALDDLYQEYPACVTAETRVSTEAGIIPIVDALGCQMTESGPVLSASRRPESPIYRMETSRGRILRGTFDHPVMTDQGFVGLADLKPGDKVVLRPPMFAESMCVARWNQIPGSETSIEITPEWARFIGIFMGDGCWYQGTVDVACDANDQDVVAEVASLMGQLLGHVTFKQVSRIPGRAGCTYVRVNRQELAETFLRLGLVRRGDPKEGGGPNIRRWVHVPDCIWRSPQHVVREFLRGLFESDGSASRGHVSFASKHVEHVRDVQLLLLGFGINSRIGQSTKRAGNGGTYHMADLSLTCEQAALFAERIGFIGARKQALALTAAKKCERKSGRGRIPLPNEMADEVASVVRDGEEATYDFTIGYEHVFSANGILTHNTDLQALAPRSLDKRIHPEWLQQCYVKAAQAEVIPNYFPKPPLVPGFVFYAVPRHGHEYVIGCLPDGEMVMTSSGEMAIEKVSMADMVVDKDGDFVDVKNIFRRPYCGDIYEIKPYCTNRPTRFTGEHPILVLKDNKQHSKNRPHRRFYRTETTWKAASEVTSKDILCFPIRNSRGHLSAEEILAHFPNQDDIRVDRRISSDVLLDNDFWFFVGLWLAEGWIHQGGSHRIKSVELALNAKTELPLASRVKDIVKRLFNRTATITVRTRAASMEVKFSSETMCAFLRDNFGQKAHGKRMAEWVKQLPVSMKASLFHGYWTGDGCVTKQKGNDTLECVSVSEQLLVDFQEILLSFGLVSSMRRMRAAQTHQIRKRDVFSKEAFSLRVAARESAVILGLMGEPCDNHFVRRRHQSYAWVEGDRLFVKIQKVSKTPFQGFVNNFETATHSYCARLIATHNCDPAEGNPTSDDSALTVLDVGTGEEVATLAGKVQPTVLAHYAGLIGEWYNGAAIMVERNNHGHAVLQALGEARMLRILSGHDGKLGWLSSVLGKAILYDLCADMFRNAETIIHSLGSYAQLSSIDGSTLRAPEGQHDDRADSYALACAGLVDVRRLSGGGMPIVLGTHGQREMMLRPGKARR